MSKPLPVPMVLDDRAEWFEAAYKGLDALIARGRSFTSDDLRDIVPVPAQPNWLGNAFQAYSRFGFIRPTGFELARARSRRGGSLRRWEPVVTRG